MIGDDRYLEHVSSTGARIDEITLLQLAREGDESAFGDLVGPYRAELRAHCYRLIGSLSDAEDALQEALLRAWRGLAGFEGRGSVRSWLYAIVTNVALDVTRHRSRRELPVVAAMNASNNSGIRARWNRSRRRHRGGNAEQEIRINP